VGVGFAVEFGYFVGWKELVL